MTLYKCVRRFWNLTKRTPGGSCRFGRVDGSWRYDVGKDFPANLTVTLDACGETFNRMYAEAERQALHVIEFERMKGRRMM